MGSGKRRKRKGLYLSHVFLLVFTHERPEVGMEIIYSENPDCMTVKSLTYG